MGLKNLFKRKPKDTILYSPIKGKAIPLSEMSDGVFSAEMLGKGVAIEPTEGKCLSPIDGEVTLVFETNHALGLETADGVEVLVHIGLETVSLKGEHFTPHVKSGDKVSVGDLLMEFDIPAIKEKGFEMTTPIIISNTEDYSEISIIKTGDIDYGEEILKVNK